MLYATGAAGQRTRATPGTRATCPYCGALMVAKCGEINVWHWAHGACAACDPWASGETAWHLSWKALVPDAWCEQVVDKGGVRHIADIRRPDGTVFELQSRPLPLADVRQREAFYDRMVWLFDVRECVARPKRYIGPSTYIHGKPHLELRAKDGYHTFRWRHARKRIAHAEKPVFLDCGEEGVLELRRFYPDAPSGGWGVLHARETFVAALQQNQGE